MSPPPGKDGHGELSEALRAIVGEQGLVSGEALRARRPVTALAGESRAGLLVRPASTEALARVLALCHARGQRVVTHGGLTGLVQGTSSGPGDLILSLEALNRIESVDPAGRSMRVQAGVTLQQAQEEAERHGLLFPLDLGGRGSATIGGNVSTNAGGLRVVRYGMMRNLVLGIEAVLADGTVLSALNRMLKNNAGYDLKQLFIGTEGTLGIVTRIDLRLVPQPRSQNTALVACPDFPALARLLGHVDASLGGQLSAFEALWPDFYAAQTRPPAPHAALLPHGHALYALIEAEGADPAGDASRLEAALEQALAQGLIEDAVIAKSAAERRAIWAPREDVFQLNRFGPLHSFDVSLPLPDMPEYVAAVRAGLERHAAGTRLFVFGHVADGNLHLIVGQARSTAAAHAIESAVYGPLQSIGGSVSAEHGIGVERKAWLGLTRTPAEIELMRLLKRTLDPRGILNPGKVIEAHA